MKNDDPWREGGFDAWRPKLSYWKLPQPFLRFVRWLPVGFGEAKVWFIKVVSSPLTVALLSAKTRTYQEIPIDTRTATPQAGLEVLSYMSSKMVQKAGRGSGFFSCMLQRLTKFADAALRFLPFAPDGHCHGLCWQFWCSRMPWRSAMLWQRVPKVGWCVD